MENGDTTFIDPRLQARLANMEDKSQLLNWRNNPEVVRFSGSLRLISEAEHECWFQNRLLLMTTEPIWIFFNPKNKIGMARLDLVSKQEKILEISIIVDSSFQNKGYGKEILLYCLSFAKEQLKSNLIYAKVHKENITSIKLFNSLSFKQIQNLNDSESFLLMELRI